MKKQTFYSNGKLLISGEYVVLDGATALAVPTKYGQSLTIEPINKQHLVWKSYDDEKALWFEAIFNLKTLAVIDQVPNAFSSRMVQILQAAKQLNGQFLNSNQGYSVTTSLDFPRQWGLGSSSTLINNIANWANVNAFQLLEKTFGGSGYDIACAQNNNAITYQKKDHNPIVQPIEFTPSFKNHLYFVYLNKKQNSRDGIKHYNEAKSTSNIAIEEINTITSKMIASKTLENFKLLMALHEEIISKITKQTPVKELLFSDFTGAIKSLGAWGGDFILVASKNNPISYFQDKGFNSVIPYKHMVL